jgi:uncharacterized protein (DUF3084 family)
MRRSAGLTSSRSASERLRMQTLRTRAKEVERMLEIGSFETKIRQREVELQSLRQRKALLESELGRLRRALDELNA